MGYYINPKDGNKLKFLSNNAQLCSKNIEWKDIPESETVVALVDNGLFFAAGICYSEQELREWKADDSGRPMTFYILPKDKVVEIHPEFEKIWK